MAQEQQPQDFLQFSAEREAPRPGRYPHAGGKRKREDRDDAVSSPSSLAATLGKDGRTPWRYASQSQFKSLPSLSPILRLHEEIIDFAAFVAPTPAEHAAADAAILRLQSIVLDVFPAARMEIFGSRANGLVLPTSDWDVLLFGVTGTTKNMHRLGAEINARGLASKMEIIDSARVPIIKLREKASGISIDISFELQAASGLITRALINDYIIRYPAVRPLVLVLKYVLIQRGLNETYSGGVGSFLLVLMVVHVVQMRLADSNAAECAEANAAGRPPPPLLGGGNRELTDGVGERSSSSSSSDTHKRKRESSSSSLKSPPPSATAADTASSSRSLPASSPPVIMERNAMNLGSLLISFLELFGHNLNYVTTGISVRGEGCYFSKNRRGWMDMNRPFLLSLENPCDPNVDVGKNSWSIVKVRRALAHAHTMLSSALRSALSNSSNSASSSGTGRRAGGYQRPDIRSYAGVGMPSAPLPSLLASVVRPDELLWMRASELSSASAYDAGAASAGSASSSSGSSSAAAAAPLGSTATSTSSSSSSSSIAAATTATAASAALLVNASNHHGRGRGGPLLLSPTPAASPSTLLHSSSGSSSIIAAGAPGAVPAAAAAAAAPPPNFNLASPSARGLGSSQVEIASASAAAASMPQDDDAIVAAAKTAALSAIAKSGVSLRHPGRLADIFTRKERKVDEISNAVVSWY